jgi:hypothetical protein
MSSVPTTVKTENGTVLPLINLKGKAYLLVAHRLQWFNEKVENFSIQTEFLKIDSEETIAKSTIVIKDKAGNVVKQASATKRETKKDFPDHTEKAESSSIGRALAMMGFGTQFALSDLDEGERIVDAPLPAAKKEAAPVTQLTQKMMEDDVPMDVRQQPTPPTSKGSSFRKPAAKKEVAQNDADGWQ